jgi:MFS family permease
MAQATAAGAVAGTEAEKPSFRTALKLPGVSILAASRAASKLAMAVLSYGAMVYLATEGATQFQISLVSASSYAAALMLGIQGGTLSDSLSKRLALVTGYVAQAALCFLVPIFWGTTVGALMFVMFMASALNQIITPSIKSATALVATPAQLATVSASITVIGSIASAVGSTFMAPLLIKHTSIKTVMFVAGLIYVVGALRTLKLPAAEQAMKLTAAVRSVEWKPKSLSLKWNAEWIVSQRSVATIILAGGIVVAMFEAFNTLMPVYIRDVLDADPANAVYIFAPAGIGFLIGTFATPWLMALIGERRLVLASLAIMCVSTFLFGIVESVAPILAPFSPLRIFEWLLDIDINDNILAASLIAVPANFGSTAAGAAVQVYINRRVPLVRQGATFGLQEVQENALTLVAVLTLGAIANVVGAQFVFMFAPFVAVGAVIWLLRYAFRQSGDTEFTSRQALGMMTDSSLDAVQASPPQAKPATKRTSETQGTRPPDGERPQE